jgi:hypothetical protein
MKVFSSFHKAANRTASWIRAHTYPALATTVLLVLLTPQQAVCQFVSPCCIQMSLGLAQINGSLVSTIGGDLKKLNSIQSDIRDFEQKVLYPATLITQTRSLLGGLWNSMHGFHNLLNSPLHSATLPNPSQLETILLSRNATNIAQVGGVFQTVYGSTPAVNTASAADRQTIDLSDAVAQDAMKRAVIYDQMADAELQAADQMQQAINNAAPGTAPMIEASAAAWLVKSQAYTQSAMADLMRVHSTDLANATSLLKEHAAASQQLQQQVGATVH